MADTKTSKQPGPARSLSAMFQQEREEAADDFDVAGLPPSLALPTRSKRTLPVPDLTGLGKVWELIGPGAPARPCSRAGSAAAWWSAAWRTGRSSPPSIQRTAR